MNIIDLVEKELMPVKREITFEIGDTVKIHYKIVEGNKERIQVYEGVVIAIDNKGINKNFTVRRISYDVGVERIFPLYSTRIAKIDVIRKGKARRAKLYFLRERTGKATKLKEKRYKTETGKAAVVSVPVSIEQTAEQAEKKD
jgi:large subunit ribosomal protein L19